MRARVVIALWVGLAACGSGPSGPTEPAAAPTPAPSASPAEGPLSGNWVGLATEEMGLITTSWTRDDFCTNRYDWEGTLSHQGTRLTGTMTSRFAGADCRSGGRAYHIPASALGNDPVTNLMTLSVNESGGVSVRWDDWVSMVGGATVEVNQDMSGTYTANTIALAGERAAGRNSWSLTFRLRRR